MRSGLYALIDLDGGSIAPKDAAVLGLSTTHMPFAGRAIDGSQPAAIQTETNVGRTTILLGFLDEPEELAAALEMPRETTPIALARAALSKYGAEAARIMRGEWSLLDWTPMGVTLMGSLSRRDPIFYARRGARLAIAPDLATLARLEWVDGEIDPLGLMFALGRYDLRRSKGDRTILASVRALPCGGMVRCDRHGESAKRADLFAKVAPFHGTFDEAIEEAERLLRHILRQQLARVPSAACLLSGGLDSSLIAMLIAEERGDAQPLICLSSAAPDESGLPDETPFARIVANHLGLPMESVAPPENPSIYRPTNDEMVGWNGPPASVRHYLYDALFRRAETLGLPLVFDGAFGELTVTAGMPLATPEYRLRMLARRLLRRSPPEGEVHSPFHVRLAPHRLAALPDAVTNALRTAAPESPARSPRERWGFVDGAVKTLEGATEVRAGQVRSAYPFRDPRLLEFFASFPASFARQGGLTRAPVRHMMKGRLPDAIRLRRSGLPFSPDYEQRLFAQAEAARERVAIFRAAGLDDWLDLDWLETTLGSLTRRVPMSISGAFELQLTAMTAEYLLWWQSGS